MNEQIYEGNWKELKGKIKEQWGKLTDDELEKTKGNFDQIYGKIQSKYGESIENVQEKFNSLIGQINKAI